MKTRRPLISVGAPTATSGWALLCRNTESDVTTPTRMAKSSSEMTPVRNVADRISVSDRLDFRMCLISVKTGDRPRNKCNDVCGQAAADRARREKGRQSDARDRQSQGLERPNLSGEQVEADDDAAL